MPLDPASALAAAVEQSMHKQAAASRAKNALLEHRCRRANAMCSMVSFVLLRQGDNEMSVLIRT
jgi:hypothetical protein